MSSSGRPAQSTGVAVENAAYLRQPHVMRFVDGIVSQLLATKPADPVAWFRDTYHLGGASDAAADPPASSAPSPMKPTPPAAENSGGSNGRPVARGAGVPGSGPRSMLDAPANGTDSLNSSNNSNNSKATALEAALQHTVQCMEAIASWNPRGSLAMTTAAPGSSVNGGPPQPQPPATTTLTVTLPPRPAGVPFAGAPPALVARAEAAVKSLKTRVERAAAAVNDARRHSLTITKSEGKQATPTTAGAVGPLDSMGMRRTLASALYEATELLLSNGIELEAVVHGLVRAAKALVSADRCAVFMPDEAKKTLTATIEGRPFVLRYGQGIAGTVARTGCAVLIPSAYEDPRFSPQVDIETGYITRDILCCPVIVEERLVAVVQLVNKVSGTFCEEDEVMFASFAQIAGIGIRNALLYKEQKRLVLRSKMLVAVSESLANAALIESKLIPVVVKHAKRIVGADRCAFFLVDQAGGTIAAHLEGVHEQLLLPIGAGIVGSVVKTRQLHNVADAYADPRFNKEIDIASGYRTQSLLSIPIFVDNEVVAVAQLVNKKVETQAGSGTTGGTGSCPEQTVVEFVEEDEETLMAFASIAGVCIRNCRLYESAQQRKRVLEMTLGLANAITGLDDVVVDDIATAVARLLLDRCSIAHCRVLVSNDRGTLTPFPLQAADPSQRRLGDVSPPPDSLVARALATRGVKRFTGCSGLDDSIGHRPDTAGTLNSSTSALPGTASGSALMSKAEAMATFGDAVGIASDIFDCVAAPMVMAGDVFGVIVVANRLDGRRTSSEEAQLFELVALFVAPKLRHAQLLAAARQQNEGWQQLMLLERGDGRRPSFGSIDVASTWNREDSAGPCHDDIVSRPTSRGAESTVAAAGSSAKSDPHAVRSERSPGMDVSVMMSQSNRRNDAFTREDVDRALAVVPAAEHIALLPTHRFDVHYFKDSCDEGEELLPMVVHMFDSLDLLKPFGISPEALMVFLMRIRCRYRPVPYHNFYHAFDVTQTLYSFVFAADLRKTFEPSDLLALLLAGLVHDIDHMGLNNAFHLKAETPMGILTSLTGTKSVLEVHHCQLAVEQLTQTNLLGSVSQAIRTQVFKTMIDCVLATDMAQHKDICGLLTNELLPVSQRSYADGGSGLLKESTSPEMRRLLLIMLLKMADISNITKAFDSSRKWGISVMEEFYKQGDAERSRGLDVTPMFDREKKQELAKGQIGFINFMGKPFFVTATQVLPPLQYLVSGIDDNLRTWERLLTQ